MRGGGGWQHSTGFHLLIWSSSSSGPPPHLVLLLRLTLLWPEEQETSHLVSLELSGPSWDSKICVEDLVQDLC